MNLTIFTLNCWAVFSSEDTADSRIKAVGNELASGKYDLALLQEVWSDKYFERLKTRAGDALPYYYYFHSGIYGSGLCIFSRFPIMDTFYHQWAVNGYFHKVQHEDWFGCSGIGYTQVLTPEGIRLNVYTSQFHADDGSFCDEDFNHRFLQAFEASQLVRQTRYAADVTIFAGDFKAEPKSKAYEMIVHNGGLTDAFAAVHGDRSDLAFGSTIETRRNSYTKKGISRRVKQGKRIDYIMFSGSDSYEVTAESCDTPLRSRVPGRVFSYSNHEAVVAKLRIGRRSGAVALISNSSARTDILEEGIEICIQALDELSVDHKSYINTSTIVFFVWLFLLVYVTLPHVNNTLWVQGFLTVIGLVALFLLYQGTVWNKMERNAILAGAKSMEVLLNAIRGTDKAYLPFFLS